METKIYNMTTHICDSENVESQPRLKVLRTVNDKAELVENIKNGLIGVPKGANVLIGGHPNYIMMMMQMSRSLRFKLWLYNSLTGRPYTATFIDRMDRFHIEMAIHKDD